MGIFLKTTVINGVPEVSPEELLQNVDKVKLIDVRTPAEFTGELAHIKGARLVTLGPDLLALLENGNRDETIVFVCRSGGRSAQATLVGLQMGYQSVYNMTGGMLNWNALNFPIER